MPNLVLVSEAVEKLQGAYRFYAPQL